jgi:hypothetical protein
LALPESRPLGLRGDPKAAGFRRLGRRANLRQKRRMYIPTEIFDFDILPSDAELVGRDLGSQASTT